MATVTLEPRTVPTGVPRLDELLGGGWQAGSAVLLYGPPFCGKHVLQEIAVAAAARSGLPCSFVLHRTGAHAMARRLHEADPDFAHAQDRVRYIDLYSSFLAAAPPNASYAVDAADVARELADARPGLVAVESTSALLLGLGARGGFTFLRSVLGRLAESGGVALLCMEAGMNPIGEVQMVKHLCSGMLEFRRRGDTYAFRAEGLPTAVNRPGWIDYEAGPGSFRITAPLQVHAIRV